MATLLEIENNIQQTEEFIVSLTGQNLVYRDYWKKPYDGNNSVADFKKRFSGRYPDVAIIVYDGLGRPAHGGRLLRNIRTSYEFDWIQKNHQETKSMYLYMIDEKQQEIDSLKNIISSNNSEDIKFAPKNHYEVLGVDSNATDDQVKDAFRKKRQLLHPDKISFMDDEIIKYATEKMQELNMANDEITKLRWKI